MPRAPDFDVLIAGAGPAGSHTALRLGRRGLRVCLLDARRFPRKKPCGEFLSPACLPLLLELDLLAELERSGAANVSGMNLFATAASARGDYAPLGRFATSHGHGLGIRREVLDTQAVRAAERDPNVTVLLGWQVSEPLLDAGGRAVGLQVTDPDGRRERLFASFLVGADGPRSRVARGLGWVAAGRGRDRFALVARFRGVEPRLEAEVHFVDHDYFAACPVDDGLFTANLVVDGESIPKGPSALEELFHERLAGAPALAERLAHAELAEPLTACGPLRTGPRRCTGPGVALVGDACGFVDPLTGEGLFFAMRGASLIATAIDEALRAPERERAALRRYARERRRELGPRYLLAGLLQRGIRHPTITREVVGLLGRLPGICDLVLGLTGDYVPPRALLSPRLWRSVLRERKRRPSPSPTA